MFCDHIWEKIELFVKAKLGAVLLVCLVFASGLVWFLRQNKTTLPLLSPMARINRPDLTDKLTQRVNTSFSLDFTRSTQLSTVSDKVSYLVFNANTGRVYLSKNTQVRMAPASFTKLMTAQVTLDIVSPDTQIETTKTSIDKVPTILGLKLGEKLTVEELLRGSIATSANDAAATLAEGSAAFYRQDLSFFIDLMNQKASLLRMNNTHFATPDGLDDQNQYSTLEDIAKMVMNVEKNYPIIVAAGKGDRDDIVADSTHGKYYLPNWNGLLGVYPGVNGLKIAYTENAGYSTIVTAARGNVSVVAILMGADSIVERDMGAAALLDGAFIAERQKPVNITKERLKRHYQVWNDLAKQIRAELKALEATNTANPLLDQSGQ